MTDHTDASTRTDDGGVDFSRRSFLAASGAAWLPLAVTDDRPGEAVEAGDLLLERDDLATPAGETYVEWATGRSALVEHFRRTVRGFAGARTLTSGFVARPGEDVPEFVESGVVEGTEETGELPVAGLLGATETWLASGRGGVEQVRGIDAAGARDAVQWTTRTDDLVDVLRLHRVDGRLLFTVASGDDGASLDPSRAVERYAATMRRKARR